MKTIKQVDVAFEKVEFMPDFKDFKDNVIYISDEYKTASHKCMCGCGTEVNMPLTDYWWKYQIDSNDRISMQPSVGNYQIPCKSHYIITKGKANFV